MADLHSAGCMARARRQENNKYHPKRERLSQEGGGGEWQKDWACTCYKKCTVIEEVSICYSSERIALASKALLNEHKKGNAKYGYSNRN